MSQVQTLSPVIVTGDADVHRKLFFNHCVQELIWTVHDESEEELKYGLGDDLIESVQLKINNQSRFGLNNGQPLDAKYFRTVQPFMHHSRVPRENIYSYSFALHPEKAAQPSGSINMSRIDNAILEFKLTTAAQAKSVKITVFARSWNILRISAGLAGLGYAN
jgi:hypothetical protein